MLAFLAAMAIEPMFGKPIPWAINFAAPGDYCTVGDVNADGFADLVRVSPKGDAFIDIALNMQAMKSLVPQRANSNWGRDCQAAWGGEVDGMPGFDVVGIFAGDTVRLAHAFKDGSFKDEPEWVKLPKKLEKPHIQMLRPTQFPNSGVYVWSEKTGDGYWIDPRSKGVQPLRSKKGVAWMAGGMTMDSRGSVMLDAGHKLLGAIQVSDHPIAWSYGDVAPTDLFTDEPTNDLSVNGLRFPGSAYPECQCEWASGDMDGDGDEDLVQFRFGSEAHSGHNVLLYRKVSSREGDSDRDGLSNEAESKLGTDPYDSDTDGDGLLDGWETSGFRGLDLKALGCDPKRKDMICLISRFSNAAKEMVESTLKSVQGYYDGIGWALHPVYVDEVNDTDQKRPWWELRDRFLPAKWRGVAHWMQVTPWGGGQADQLGDGGGCGGNAWSLYATFIHEFGHQLGLSHEGFYPAAWCPTYPSMMNYAYSYGYEDDIKKIRYSDGSLKDFVMNERDLDEVLPLPYDKVKFLERGPYHYRLKANGETTLIDWNWNGVFGEQHVRADINYAYSTTAGRRDEVGKTQCAPWTFTHEKEGYVLYGQQAIKPDGKSDPSLLPDKPGWLLLRRLIKPFTWAEPIKIVSEGVTGDPVAISYRGEVVVAYPSVQGTAITWLKLARDKVSHSETILVNRGRAIPSLGIYKGRLYLLEWTPAEGTIRYRTLVGGHAFSGEGVLIGAGAYPAVLKSTVPVSMAVDTIHDEVIIGLAENQDAQRPDRWALRRFKVSSSGELVAPGGPGVKPDGNREWIEGEKGGARGGSRCIVLFDEKGITGMKGRILYFGRGGVSDKTPWACEYVAQSVADKSVGSGWMVKRYYDEWTCSRSACGAAWFNGDILYAYRWVDGSQGDRDNVLHVSYNGTGIESVPMGDFDDIGYIRDFGMRSSILYLRQ